MTSDELAAYERKRAGDHAPPPLADEHAEQVEVIKWVRDATARYPDLALLFAVPNGGHRHKVIAAKLKAEGVLPGVPDLFLPQPRGKVPGLFIEMKHPSRRHHADACSPAQRDMIAALTARGYRCVVAFGHAEAIAAIEGYLA